MEATQLKESTPDKNEELQDEELHESRLHAELESQIHDYVGYLSVERLKVIVDMMAYLKDREEEEATKELLAIPNFERDLEKAERSIETEGTVDWRSIRNDVF